MCFGKWGGKWNKIAYNDIDPLLSPLITEALDGKYATDNFVPDFVTREDFLRLKESDGYIKWIWSFGNNGNDYMYSRKIEDDKHKIHDFVVFGKPSDITEGIELTCQTISERRLEWMKIAKSKNISSPRLQHLERLRHLSNLADLQDISRLESLMNIDYREYEYQEGDVVYCDIPYEDAINPTDYGGAFNHAEFYGWAKSQPFPVYFSSYPLIEEVWRNQVRSTMNSAKGGVNRTEVLYKI